MEGRAVTHTHHTDYRRTKMSGLTIISMDSGSLIISKSPDRTRVSIDVYDGPVMPTTDLIDFAPRPNFSNAEHLRTVWVNKTDLNLLINTLQSHL